MLTILRSTIWSKLERWKNLICCCLMSWTQTQNIVVLKYHLLLFYTTTNDFRLWCVMKSELYIWTSNDQLNDWTEKQLQSTSQSQICTKKRQWSLFGGLLPIWSITAFWIPVKSLYLRIMPSKLNEKHWKVQCLQPALVNRKGPILIHDKAQPHVTQPMLQKLSESVYKVLLHLPYSPDLAQLPLLKHLDNFFAGKTLLQPAGCFPRVCWIPSTDFYTTGIKLILIAKNVLNVMVFIWTNKEELEPTYNYLKFMVQYWNYLFLTQQYHKVGTTFWICSVQ